MHIGKQLAQIERIIPSMATELARLAGTLALGRFALVRCDNVEGLIARRKEILFDRRCRGTVFKATIEQFRGAFPLKRGQKD